MRKLARIGALIALLVAGVFALPVRGAQSQTVKGSWQSKSDTSASCQSPIGVCRAGVLRNPVGKQIATFHFTMDTLTPRSDGTIAFTGREVQTYGDGTIVANDSGVLTPSPTGTAAVAVAIAVVDGSGTYEDVTGLLEARGTLNFVTDQASGTYAGTLTKVSGSA